MAEAAEAPWVPDLNSSAGDPWFQAWGVSPHYRTIAGNVYKKRTGKIYHFQWENHGKSTISTGPAIQ